MTLQTPASFNPELAAWLSQQGIALALSTYRANRLIFLGVDQSQTLRVHERLYDRPMGLFTSGQSLWMAGRSHLWRFDNLLAPGQHHDDEIKAGSPIENGLRVRDAAFHKKYGHFLKKTEEGRQIRRQIAQTSEHIWEMEGEYSGIV